MNIVSSTCWALMRGCERWKWMNRFLSSRDLIVHKLFSSPLKFLKRLKRAYEEAIKHFSQKPQKALSFLRECKCLTLEATFQRFLKAWEIFNVYRRYFAKKRGAKKNFNYFLHGSWTERKWIFTLLANFSSSFVLRAMFPCMMFYGYFNLVEVIIKRHLSIQIL